MTAVETYACIYIIAYSMSMTVGAVLLIMAARYIVGTSVADIRTSGQLAA